MNTPLTLFETHPFLSPLDATQALQVQTLLRWFAHVKKGPAIIELPEKITDHLLYCFLKELHNSDQNIDPQAWRHFIKSLFNQGLIKQLSSPSLCHYLLIQLAQHDNLTPYIEPEKRLHLAYVALHSGQESRSILLNHAKHFNIANQEALVDLAFKGILLGGALDIDLTQFMPIRYEVLKQLIFLIGRIDRTKALLELKNLESLASLDLDPIRSILKAS
jgi:hypothetical protein